jgi:hypothetical protein
MRPEHSYGDEVNTFPKNNVDPLTGIDIIAAYERIKDYIVRTPLLGNSELDRSLGARVLVKAEVLQRTGSPGRPGRARASRLRPAR